MKWIRLPGMAFLGLAIGCACAQAQAPGAAQNDANLPAAAGAPVNSDPGPVPLEWVPPALTQLSSQAAVKSNFTLDRGMLTAAASLLPDSDAPTRQAVAKPSQAKRAQQTAARPPGKIAAEAPAAAQTARLFSGDGGAPNPNAGFLGFDTSRR